MEADEMLHEVLEVRNIMENMPHFNVFQNILYFLFFPNIVNLNDEIENLESYILRTINPITNY